MKCFLKTTLLLTWIFVLFALPAFAQNIEDLQKGVVKIEATTFGVHKVGTGCIVRLEPDAVYIVTVAHVVEGDDQPEVTFFTQPNTPVTAEVIGLEGGDPRGFALLLVRGAGQRSQNLAALALTSARQLQPLDDLTVIGFPRMAGPWSVITARFASRMGRDILLDGAIDEGFSGGPMLKDGQIAGLLTASSGQYGRAIPAASVQLFLDGYRVFEERAPFLAATPTPLPTVSQTEQQVAQLLTKADAYFARKWYTTPEATNAFDVYLEALTLDPTNAHAHQQIDRMAEFYKSAAEQAIGQGKTERGVQFYQRYLTIVPDDEAILDRIAELTATPTPAPIATATPTASPTVAPKPQATATLTPRPAATPTTPPASEPVPGQEYHDPVSGIDFVYVPQGCFRMGSPNTEESRGSNEGPVHDVCLDGFWMGKYEVTQSQWQQVMGHNPARFQGDSLPVEQVSWDDAQEFLQNLNTQAGREIYRLPSEAEWEYAARAGTTTPFHFGETITTDLANYRGTDWKIGDTVYSGAYGDGPKGIYREKTTEVGSFPSNAFGLYDMHGNVWEWCQDWYGSDYYSKSPKNNPQGPETGESRVLRGGSWFYFPNGCRSAFRLRLNPVNRVTYVGFRVVVGVVAWTL